MVSNDALYRVDSIIIEGLREQVRQSRELTHELITRILTGGELRFFDKPVQFQVTWPDGPPFGWTNEQVAEARPYGL